MITPVHQRQQLFGIFALGFASGLPFLLTLSTLSFWLAEAGVSTTTVGLFMLVSIPYSIKFLWAPAIDTFDLPVLSHWFGRRRSWALISQIGLIGSLLFLSQTNPLENIYLTALAAFCVSAFAASQDIVIDAYRIEVLHDKHLGLGAALESIGFRFGMLTSGAGALYLAYIFGWAAAYQIMAILVLLGMITVLLMPEKLPLSTTTSSKPTKLIDPWREVFRHENLFWIIAFILFFKMADTVLNAMSASFLVDLGYSKLEFANISKIFGISLMIIGGLFAGGIMHQFGLVSALLGCMILQSVACFMFTIQALVGYDLDILVITIGVESFCSGMTSAAFIAYLSTFCKAPHIATHFTVWYSLNSLCRVGISAFAGWFADLLGWELLFFFTSFTILPAGLALIYLEYRHRLSSEATQMASTI